MAKQLLNCLKETIRQFQLFYLKDKDSFTIQLIKEQLINYKNIRNREDYQLSL